MWATLVLSAVFGLALLAVVALIVVVVWKRRRTAVRRRVRAPDAQIIGAWHDVLDRLRECGVEQPERQTVDDLVAGTEATSGGALAGLYRPVNRALYDDAPCSPDDAEQAWRARDRYVEALRHTEPIHRRLRRSIDPRPLVHRAPRPDHAQPESKPDPMHRTLT